MLHTNSITYQNGLDKVSQYHREADQKRILNATQTVSRPLKASRWQLILQLLR